MSAKFKRKKPSTKAAGADTVPASEVEPTQDTEATQESSVNASPSVADAEPVEGTGGQFIEIGGGKRVPVSKT